MQTYHVFLACVVAALFAIIPFASTASIKKREISGRDVPLQTKSKRPFCNAFTGCGKKRSFDAFANNADMETADTDLDKLGRQILSEARMWEALQARLEALRREQEEDGSRYPLYLRKRRSVSRLSGQEEDRNMADVSTFQKETGSR